MIELRQQGATIDTVAAMIGSAAVVATRIKIGIETATVKERRQRSPTLPCRGRGFQFVIVLVRKDLRRWCQDISQQVGPVVCAPPVE